MRLDQHAYGVDLSDGTVTCANEQIAVLEQCKHVDALLEEAFGWADSLVELADEIDLDNITSERTEVGSSVVGSNFDALVLSLDLASVDVLEGNFLGD